MTTATSLPHSPTSPTQNPLDALEPNILPAPIDWFPPAPGWWVLAIAMVGLCVGVTLWLIRRHRRNVYRRTALTQLHRIAQSYQQHRNLHRLAGDCNQLLKATALQVWPRVQIANLHGPAWLTFLDRSLDSSKAAFEHGTGATLGTVLYDGKELSGSGEKLLKLTGRWIRHHKMPPANGTGDKL